MTSADAVVFMVAPSLAANRQCVLARQQCPPDLTRTGAQHRPLRRGVNQEDLRVIEAETVTDEVHGKAEEVIDFTNLIRRAGDFSRGFEVGGSGGNTFFQ